MAKRFMLFDGRAKGGDTSRAAVLEVCDSEADARRVGRRWEDGDAVWFEYDLVRNTRGGDDVAINELMRADLPPGGK